MNLIKNRKTYIIFILICITIFTFSACGMNDYYVQQQVEEALGKTDADFFSTEIIRKDDSSAIQDEQSAKTEDLEIAEVIEEPEEVLLPEDMTDFDIENAFSYCTTPICNIDDIGEQIVCSFRFKNKVPLSDDDNIYLFELFSHENDEKIEDKKPVAEVKKGKEVKISIAYAPRKLFSRYYPAILFDGEYIPLAKAQFITNPEVLAKNIEDYSEDISKKGILLDANTIDKKELYDLDVKRIIYNLPLSYVIGESTSEACPTIEYTYDGETYQFNTYLLAGFDGMFKYLTDNGFHTTVIILNDWNEEHLEVIHPLSRKKTWRSLYYAFNTEEEDGTKLLEAVATFLADRYTGGDYGMVYDWVIANEVNQQAIWNYMATNDLTYYTESFERSFRIFYNAIKSNYANANIYYSIDHDWNDNGGNNNRFFNGRDFIYEFNEIAKGRGNYDWGLSIHPYPKPLTRTRFWTKEYDKSEESKVVTPMNLSTLTSVLTKKEFLDTNNEVRSIGVTELGFSSREDEDAQAAAFAYCYYIIEDNEYIDTFLLNRQHDDLGALESGLSLGIYNYDYSKKKIADVFKNIDSKKGERYISEMLKIIGADNIEEALEKAR